jgi:hypothetical protein
MNQNDMSFIHRLLGLVLLHYHRAYPLAPIVNIYNSPDRPISYIQSEVCHHVECRTFRTIAFIHKVEGPKNVPLTNVVVGRWP